VEQALKSLYEIVQNSFERVSSRALRILISLNGPDQPHLVPPPPPTGPGAYLNSAGDILSIF